MNLLFRGCDYVNSDGINRSMTKNEGKASQKTISDYLKNKEKRQ